MAIEKIPERKDIDPSFKWDLSPLFAGDAEWEALFSSIEQRLGRYNDYRGRLHESLSVFREAIDFDLSMSRDIERLYTYAHLKSDEDKADQRCLALHQRWSALSSSLLRCA